MKKDSANKELIIDAQGRSAGRIASRAANLLQGKNDVRYAPNREIIRQVVIKNISQIVFTGKKIQQKKYFHYSGYPGGLKTNSLAKLWKSNPGKVVRNMVYQMLPANRLRKQRIKRLKILE